MGSDNSVIEVISVAPGMIKLSLPPVPCGIRVFVTHSGKKRKVRTLYGLKSLDHNAHIVT